MTYSSLIQIFLYAQVFIMGALAAIAVRHAVAHYKDHHRDPNIPQLPSLEEPLTPAFREHLLKLYEQKFQTALDRSAVRMEEGLDESTKKVDNLVTQLASNIVGEELDRYHQRLAEMHKQAEQEMTSIGQRIADSESAIKSELAKEIEDERQKMQAQLQEEKQKALDKAEAEKQLLIKQIDTKLADAVGSFLTEALQHNVDLGSQAAYLTSVLEEHKDDFKKEIS